MRAVVILIHSPRFDGGVRLGKRGKLVHVHTLVTQAPITLFNKDIFHRFARSNEVELHTPPIGPIFHGA